MLCGNRLLFSRHYWLLCRPLHSGPLHQIGLRTRYYIPLLDDLILLPYASAIAPLSSAERQWRYRERIKADEERRELFMAKERQRWHERVESGKVKLSNNVSEREKLYRIKKATEARIR